MYAKKLLRAAELFYKKAANVAPSVIERHIRNIEEEINQAVTDEYLFSDDLKNEISFILSKSIEAAQKEDDDYLFSLMKALYRLIEENEAVFRDPSKIYFLIGQPTKGLIDGGIMQAIKGTPEYDYEY